MENASKALLIAGAILIVIVLIGIGILIINSIGGVTDQAGNQADTMAKQQFNSQFTAYEGTVNAQQVKSLFALIRSSNASNGTSEASDTLTTSKTTDKYVYLDGTTGNITKTSELSANEKYSVEITGYSAGGFVQKIKVTKKS